MMIVNTEIKPRFDSIGRILLVVQFPWLSEEVPFLASPDDIEGHGQELYSRAMAGEFGEIEPYVAPVKTPEQATAEAKAARAAAYVAESDPLFFKYQRGEVEKSDWLAKVEEIRARYPA